METTGGGSEEVGGNQHGPDVKGKQCDRDYLHKAPGHRRGGNLNDNLIGYARESSRQIRAIFENPLTLSEWKRVDTIIISARVMSGGASTATREILSPNA
jgi:hypothetical protein